jgi:flagellar biosynthesis regulator FlaF
MSHRNPNCPDSSLEANSARKIWCIIKQLDQILAELDALNMHLAANHISLGTEILRQVRTCPPKD